MWYQMALYQSPQRSDIGQRNEQDVLKQLSLCHLLTALRVVPIYRQFSRVPFLKVQYRSRQEQNVAHHHFNSEPFPFTFLFQQFSPNVLFSLFCFPYIEISGPLSENPD